MAFIAQQRDIDAVFLPEKQLLVRLELMNDAMMPIDRMEGVLIEGSYSIDAESDIRRTCDLTIHLNDRSYTLGEDRRIWVDKLVRIYVGFRGGRQQEALWYNIGTYLFTAAAYSYSSESRTLTLSCSDLMANLTAQTNGELPSLTTTISEGSNIRDTLISTVTDLGYVSKYIVDNITINGVPATVPHDLKFSAGDSVYDVITKLRDLYPGWEAFFDEDGVFIYQQIPTCAEDGILLDESIMQKLVISEEDAANLENIRNTVVVWGMLKKDGTQITGRYQDDNPDSPFCVAKLGPKVLVCSGGDYDKIATDYLANQRAEYECYLHTRLEDSITLKALIVPWLDVNKKIRYRSAATGETHDYIVKVVSFDLTNGTMTVGAIRFYPLYPTVVSH